MTPSEAIVLRVWREERFKPERPIGPAGWASTARIVAARTGVTERRASSIAYLYLIA